MIVFELKDKPNDINKWFKFRAKEACIPVLDFEAHLIVKNEPGRIWVKFKNRASVIAYG